MARPSIRGGVGCFIGGGFPREARARRGVTNDGRDNGGDDTDRAAQTHGYTPIEPVLESRTLCWWLPPQKPPAEAGFVG